MSFAGLSLLGFLIRGYWMIVESDFLNKKLVKILPHIIDTGLLVTAIILVMLSRMYPFTVDWVTLKVVLLIVYIISGTIALKRGKNKQQRIMAFAFSLLVILSIFAIASIKPHF